MVEKHIKFDELGVSLFQETSNMDIYCYCDVQTFINIRFATVRDPYPSSPGSGLMKKKYGLLWKC